MNADRLENEVRGALRTWAPGDSGPPPGIADRIVRRRRRRTRLRAAGAALALTGVALGTTLVTGAAGDDAPPAFRVSEESDLLWRTTLPGISWDACTTGPGAVFCRGALHDAVGIDARTGDLQWQRRAVPAGSSSSPAGALPGVRDGILYTYADHSPGAPAPGTDLVALGTDGRQVLWRHELADDSRDRASAVLFDGGILAGGPGARSVTALEPRTGRTLWTHSWDGADCDRAAIGGVPHLMCSPDEGSPARGSTVVRLDPATGAPRTVASVAGPTTWIGTDRDAVLLGAGELAGGAEPTELVRVDLRTGAVARHPVDGLPAGVVADGIVLASGANGRAVAYAAGDGRRLWSRELGLDLRAEPGDPTAREHASAAAVDLRERVAYYLGPNGRLTGLDLDSGAVRWRARVQVSTEPVAGGTAPELMLRDGSLIGLAGGELFRIRPVLH
ncbi:PQQ-binding-like beta-propeller repeat protein [Streptomyces genisteinicus]|uniref:PQQ-binding-like beta-propeller repeat protein n=1 Tax=Streptomyces genisteinicus TaxID=2768068 RepID=A0A7H0HLX7_9ACTN|nr:PQQ-binding-like beta-propeller repeat protein [Streptomyces genisteinicus]QNP61543.1 PQQ-binding-like beta-propeller repeat protein [Streptomyces genisteinicus]